MKMIGDPFWLHGPLVFAPKKLAARFVKDFAKAKPVFDKLRKDQSKKIVGPRIATVLGVDVLLLPNGTPTGWMPMKHGGVFVRPIRELKGKRPAESFVVPETLDAPLKIDGDWVLFDSLSAATDESPMYVKLRAKKLLPVKLAPGTYVVEYSTPKTFAELEYAAVRLRLEGSAAPGVVEVAGPPAFPVTAEMKQQVKSLRFVESEGGPFVALPQNALAGWRGIEGDEDGATDYDRACDARGFVLGKNEGLILQEPDSTALVATKDGVVFVRWVGADRPIDLLAALPHAKKWKKEKKPLDVPGPLVLFDATLEGKKLPKKARLDVPLKQGAYDIEWTEVDGVVEGGHEVMAGFVKLTRRK